MTLKADIVHIVVDGTLSSIVYKPKQSFTEYSNWILSLENYTNVSHHRDIKLIHKWIKRTQKYTHKHQAVKCTECRTCTHVNARLLCSVIKAVGYWYCQNNYIAARRKMLVIAYSIIFSSSSTADRNLIIKKHKYWIGRRWQAGTASTLVKR